jgi:hypothetical protein
MQMIASGLLSLFLYICLALIAIAFVGLNLRVGPPIGGRSLSITELVRDRPIPRIGDLKLILVVLWIVLFLIVIYRHFM